MVWGGKASLINISVSNGDLICHRMIIPPAHYQFGGGSVIMQMLSCSHKVLVFFFNSLPKPFARYRNDPKFFGQICLGKQCRPRSDCSGSTLFAILSASFGLITLW